MEKFRTPIKIEVAEREINYASKIFFIGSCFSENIFKKVNTLAFEAL